MSARLTYLLLGGAAMLLAGCNAVLGYETATLESHDDVPSTPAETSATSASPSADASATTPVPTANAPVPAAPPTPVEIVRGLDRPAQLALAGANAWWIQPDGIWALELGGAANAPRRVVTVTGALAFAVSVDRVYYTVQGKDGLFTAREGEAPTVFIADPHDAHAVVVTGPRVFVSQSELTHGKVFWKDGSQLQNVGVPNGAEPWAMAANEMGDVYFTTRRDVCAGGRVFRFANPPVEISSTETCPTAIAASGADVFVTNAVDGGSVRRLRAGAAPVDIAVQQGEPIAIAVSRDDVVWANHASGEIMRAPRAGGKPVPIVEGAAAPSGVGFDATATNVYWLTQGSAPSSGRLFVAAVP